MSTFYTLTSLAYENNLKLEHETVEDLCSLLSTTEQDVKIPK